jgi:MFS transporter, putative metabolite:H+ symporter
METNDPWDQRAALGGRGLYDISEHDSISDISTSQSLSSSYRQNDQLLLPHSSLSQKNDTNNSHERTDNPLNNLDSSLQRVLTKSPSQVSAYWRSIEEIIESIPLGAFHSRILWICGIAFMADGMVSSPPVSHCLYVSPSLCLSLQELSLLAFISLCAQQDLGFTDIQTSLLISLVFLGEFFGSISFGMIADRMGRLKAFIFGMISALLSPPFSSLTLLTSPYPFLTSPACFLIALAGILSGYAVNFRDLVLARMAVGFGVGGLAVPFDLVSEFSPTHSRGSLLVYLRGAHCLGAIYIATIALILSPSVNWRTMTFIATLPAIIAIPCAIIFIPESPRWLLDHKKTLDAEKSLHYVAYVNGIALPQFRLLFSGKDDALSESTATLSSLFSYDLLSLTIPLLSLWLCFGFSYHGVVLFINKIFERDSEAAGDGACSFHSQPIFGSALAELIGLLVTYFLIDHLGRISTQSSFYAGAGVSVLMLSLQLPSLALAVVASFARGTVTSAIAATWTLTPELYPTRLRSSGHSLANSFSRLGAFLVPYAIHNATNHIPAMGTGIILAVVNALAMILSLFLPETMGKPLDQVTLSPFLFLVP